MNDVTPSIAIAADTGVRSQKRRIPSADLLSFKLQTNVCYLIGILTPR